MLGFANKSLHQERTQQPESVDTRERCTHARGGIFPAGDSFAVWNRETPGGLTPGNSHYSLLPAKSSPRKAPRSAQLFVRSLILGRGSTTQKRPSTQPTGVVGLSTCGIHTPRREFDPNCTAEREAPVANPAKSGVATNSGGIGHASRQK